MIDNIPISIEKQNEYNCEDINENNPQNNVLNDKDSCNPKIDCPDKSSDNNKNDNSSNNEDNTKCEYLFTIYHNRYNVELEETTRLRNESIFILTVIGFLITCGIGVVGADWFKLDVMITYRNIKPIVIIIPYLLACILKACTGLFSYDATRLHFPENEFYLNGQNINSDFKNCNISLSKCNLCKNIIEVTSYRLLKNADIRINLTNAKIYLVISIMLFISIIIYYVVYAFSYCT